MAALEATTAALVRLSAAIAAGKPGDVERAVEEALDAGTEDAAIYEAMFQSYLFLGFPRAIEAFFAARPVLARKGGRAEGGTSGGPTAPAPTDPRMGAAAWQRDGEALCRRVYGRNYEKLMATMRDLSPDLASRMILEGYGKTLSRPGLGVVEREYAIVAILTVTRMWRQLRSHAIGAVHVGGSRAAVRAAIELCRPWTGGGTVEEALRVVRGENGNAGR